MEKVMQIDERIKADVVDQMRWDDRIDASKVKVTVDDGHVTLTGSAPTYMAKQAAADDAWLVIGVKSITNQLEITYPSTADIPADEEIRSNVENVLLWDPDLNSFKIDVTVRGGWITLEGTVDSFWEKIRAENAAWNVMGVIGVTNKLVVVPTEKITDELVGQDVADAIDRNLSVDVDDVTVTVEEGEVTLAGTVPTWAAKSAAFRSALYTRGVVDVDNEIVVDYTLS